MQLITLYFSTLIQKRVLFTLLLLLSLTACATGQESKTDAAQSDGEGEAKIEVSNAWARPAKVMTMDEADKASDQEDEASDGDAHEEDQETSMQHSGTTSAIYLTIKNLSAQNDRLDHVRVDEIANVIELHQTTIENDVMKMQPVEGGIPIPAGEEVELKPGDYHLMLIDVQYNLKAGDHFEAELHFENAGAVTVEVEVREP